MLMQMCQPSVLYSLNTWNGTLQNRHGLISMGCRTMQGLVAGAADRGRSAVQCVLCLGHNKGMEEAASDLAVRAMAVLPGVSARLGDLMRPNELWRVTKALQQSLGR